MKDRLGIIPSGHTSVQEVNHGGHLVSPLIQIVGIMMEMVTAMLLLVVANVGLRQVEQSNLG